MSRPAKPLIALQHEHGKAGLRQIAGGDETIVAAAHDRDVVSGFKVLH